MNLDRREYGEIYHRTFGKTAGREACRDGWRRWQKVWSSGHEMLVLQRHGAPMPEPHPNDYWAFTTVGPLQFLARINEAFLPLLPEGWLEFTRSEGGTKILAACGQNPRSRARGFIHNMLVEGFVMDPVIGPAMAGAIAWLLSTVEGQPMQLSDFHLFGYDISYVPGPPGQKAMFNFRAVFNPAPEQTEGMLNLARALPLPEWRPPPH